MTSKLRQKGLAPVRSAKGATVERVYAHLREEIVSLLAVPGSALEEGTVAARLGVSRTPVREAFSRLSSDGLVMLLPNRGAHVASLDWDDIREHLEAFDVAQRLVMRWAALRRSQAEVARIQDAAAAFEVASARHDVQGMLDTNFTFHAMIATTCRNRELKTFFLRLLSQNLRISRLAMNDGAYPSEGDYRTHLSAILSEHRRMVESIRDGDADAAEALAASHANLARARVTATLTQSLRPAMMPKMRDPVE